MEEVFGKGTSCCGCSACAAICGSGAISMYRNAKGFLEPFILDVECVDCGQCRAICPVLNRHIQSNPDFKTFLYKADREHREHSQSGAAFGVIAEQFILSGGIVYGAVLDDLYCKYTSAHTLEELMAIKKSKYVQADVGDVFSEIGEALQSGKRILFGGTPCHVDGLRSYIKNKCINDSHLYLIDIVCHGTPSPMLFENYLEYFSKTHRDCRIKDFNFRDKRFGWYGHVTISTGKRQIVSDAYNKLFYSHYAHRDSCFACKYANLDRPGDLTVGDA